MIYIQVKQICFSFLICLAYLGLGCSEKPSAGKQVLITEGLSRKVVDAYWLYLPRNYDPGKHWPVILFLQGGLGVSPNPQTCKEDGPSKFALLYSDKIEDKTLVSDTFIIINPHMRVGPSEKRQWYQFPATLEQIVDDVVARYSGDTNRIYLTGLSRGGIGAWNLAKQLPEKFAAMIPISGRINCKIDCDKIAGLPMWIIHNTRDPTVDFEYSSESVEYLDMNFNKPFYKLNSMDPSSTLVSATHIFSALDRDGHDAWNEAYASPSLYIWMLDKTRKD